MLNVHLILTLIWDKKLRSKQLELLPPSLCRRKAGCGESCLLADYIDRLSSPISLTKSVVMLLAGLSWRKVNNSRVAFTVLG